VCARADYDEAFTSLLHDPLIRLVMLSDGVTEDAMAALLSRVSQSLAARAQPRQPTSDVYCPPFHSESGLFHGLFQRGMCMASPRDVLG
jgi:hypothetical protein